MPTEEDIAVELGQSVLPSRQDGMVAASRDHRRVLQYTASVQLRSRPTRHDTRQMQNSLANSQHPLFFYFTLPLFHQPGCGAWSSLSCIAASLIQSSERMGIYFFGLLSRNPAGTQKGRKREIKKTAQSRVLIIFVIVPEPVER